MIVDGNVEVVSVFKEKAENPKLIISEISSDGDMDYIILYNPYDEDVSTLGYSVTDNKDKPGKLILPSRIIANGESLKIIGENNMDTSGDNVIRAGFNLKDGETVALYENGEIIDEVTIPDLEDGSVYTRDIKNMRFYELRK